MGILLGWKLSHRKPYCFVVGFIVCYGIQFLVVWLLNYKTALRGYEIDIYSFTLSGYGLATLIGNVVYTGSNFMFNKLVTFKTHL